MKSWFAVGLWVASSAFSQLSSASPLTHSLAPSGGVLALPHNLGLVSPCKEPCVERPKKGASVARGSQPSKEGFRYLRDVLGVRTIVNLRYMPYDIELAKFALNAVNAEDSSKPQLTMVSYAWNPLLAPTDDKIDELLKLLKSATPGNAGYVHCTKGRDRTGMLIALHRVLNEGWKPQAAYDEAVRYGFDTPTEAALFTPMYKYFVKRTAPFGTVQRYLAGGLLKDR